MKKLSSEVSDKYFESSDENCVLFSDLDIFLLHPLDTKVSRESDVMMRSDAEEVSPHMEHDFSNRGRKNCNLSSTSCEVKSTSVALF